MPNECQKYCSMNLFYVVIIGLLVIVIVYLIINQKPKDNNGNDSNSGNNNGNNVQAEAQEDGLDESPGGQALKQMMKNNASNSNPLIIMVYMDGCGFCEKMKPEFKKANNANSNTPMAMVNV